MHIQPHHITSAVKAFVAAVGDQWPAAPSGAAVATFTEIQLSAIAAKCAAIGMPHEASAIRSACREIRLGMLDGDATRAIANPQRAADMLAAELDIVCATLASISASGADLEGAMTDRVEAMLSSIHLDGRIYLGADGVAIKPPHGIVQDHARRLPTRTA